MSIPPTEMDTESDTDPEKPLRLVSVIVELVEAPVAADREAGLRVMRKSGVSFVFTWRDI